MTPLVELIRTESQRQTDNPGEVTEADAAYLLGLMRAYAAATGVADPDGEDVELKVWLDLTAPTKRSSEGRAGQNLVAGQVVEIRRINGTLMVFAARRCGGTGDEEWA